jgi:hypothetical protein
MRNSDLLLVHCVFVSMNLICSAPSGHISVAQEIQQVSVTGYSMLWRYAVAQLVEALSYKSEGREFNSRWSH